MTHSEETAVVKIGLFCQQCGFEIDTIQAEGVAFSVSNRAGFSKQIYGVPNQNFIAFFTESHVPYQDDNALSISLALRQFKRNAKLVYCFWSTNFKDEDKFTVMSNVPFSQLELDSFKEMVEEMFNECTLFNSGVAYALDKASR